MNDPYTRAAAFSLGFDAWLTREPCPGDYVNGPNHRTWLEGYDLHQRYAASLDEMRVGPRYNPNMARYIAVRRRAA